MQITLELTQGHIDALVRTGWLDEAERHQRGAVISAAHACLCAAMNDLGLSVRAQRLRGAGEAAEASKQN